MNVGASGHVVLVAGVSCSGKSTLASSLSEALGALHLRMDDYYRGFESLSVADRKVINFDAPPAVEHELLIDHVHKLKHGHAVDVPVYDHAAYARTGAHWTESRPVVVVEGLFCLYWAELLAMADVSVFVDTPLHECLERRLFRDTMEFNRSREEALNRYLFHVAPNQDQYVLPTRDRADLIVRGDHHVEEAIGCVRQRLANLAPIFARVQPEFA